MYNNLFDSHTHSDYSFDGVHSVMYMCEAALRKGFLGVAVTDHCNVNRKERLRNLQRMRQYFYAICKARAAFGKVFVLSAGVEIAEPDENPAFADEMLGQGRFDFVVGAVHTAGGWGDPQFCNFTVDDPYAVLDEYFAKVWKLLEWGKFDALAHLEYPMRYIARDGRRDITLQRYDEQIQECLRWLAQSGKALEIDTAGLRGPLGRLQPQLEHLRRFRQLGGENVTIGSDAHRVEEIGAGVEDGMDLMLEAGFQYFAFYKQREPRMMSLY